MIRAARRLRRRHVRFETPEERGNAQFPGVAEESLASSAAMRAASFSFSARASAAISRTASNSSRETKSMPAIRRSSWLLASVSTSRRAPSASPAASVIRREKSSNMRLRVCGIAKNSWRKERRLARTVARRAPCGKAGLKRRLSGQQRLHDRAGLGEVHLPGKALFERGDDLAHVLDAGGAGCRDGGLRRGGDLGLAHLLGQKLADDGDLGAFLRGEIGPPGLLINGERFLA